MGFILNPYRLAITEYLLDLVSMYESLQALTSIQNNHFVEWFSGTDLSAIWDIHDVVGVNTEAMADEIDGGWKHTNSTTSGSQSYIDFNNKRQYDQDASIIIGIYKISTITSSRDRMGFLGADDFTNHYAYVQGRGSVSVYYGVQTDDGTSTSHTAGTATFDTNWHTQKLTLNGTNAILHTDGVLEVTKSSNYPNSRMQPHWDPSNLSTTAISGQIRYLEAYNTSPTITSDIYERLSATTQLLNQRLVETFHGKNIQPDRWTIDNDSGTGAATMTDAVDAGLKIASEAVNNADTTINFNNIRQYDSQDLVEIFVSKRETVSTNLWHGINNASTWGSTANMSVMVNDTDDTYFTVRTDDGSTGSESATDLAIDTDWHVFKLDTDASNNYWYIDGVLKVTKTTNLPTGKTQPAFRTFSRAIGASSGSVRYLEIWNHLGTETDYESLYSFFNPLTTVAKIHFWEWFQGQDIDFNKWERENFVSTGTFAMTDEESGGYSIINGAASNGSSGINFFQKRQYDPTGCEMIFVTKRVSSVSNLSDITFSNLGAGSGEATDLAGMRHDSAATYVDCMTADASTRTSTSSDVAQHANWTVVKIALDGTDTKMYLDGVLKVTKTTNKPTVKLQPQALITTRAGDAREIRMRYMECKNT